MASAFKETDWKQTRGISINTGSAGCCFVSLCLPRFLRGRDGTASPQSCLSPGVGGAPPGAQRGCQDTWLADWLDLSCNGRRGTFPAQLYFLHRSLVTLHILPSNKWLGALCVTAGGPSHAMMITMQRCFNPTGKIWCCQTPGKGQKATRAVGGDQTASTVHRRGLILAGLLAAWP